MIQVIVKDGNEEIYNHEMPFVPRLGEAIALETNASHWRVVDVSWTLPEKPGGTGRGTPIAIVTVKPASS